MTLLDRLQARLKRSAPPPAPTPSDHARALAKEGTAQRRNRVLAKAAQIRADLGLEPLPVLEGR